MEVAAVVSAGAEATDRASYSSIPQSEGSISSIAVAAAASAVVDDMVAESSTLPRRRSEPAAPPPAAANDADSLVASVVASAAFIRFVCATFDASCTSSIEMVFCFLSSFA